HPATTRRVHRIDLPVADPLATVHPKRTRVDCAPSSQPCGRPGNTAVTTRMAQPLANSPALSVTVYRGHADWPQLEQCQATPNLFGAVACLQSAPKHPAQRFGQMRPCTRPAATTLGLTVCD